MSIISYDPSNREEKEIKIYNHTVCDFCKKDVITDEHSIIFGSSWYHMQCFIEEGLVNGT